jgi:anaerobic selenocysteine-containing dehydrogenase
MSETHSSYCRLCLHSCAVLVDVEDGRIVRIRGDKQDPIYRGFVCTKGVNQTSFINGPMRLLHSQKRQPDGTYQPIGSELALDEIADKLRGIIDRHGPNAVLNYMSTSGIYVNSINAVFSMAFCEALKTKWHITAMTIDQAGKMTAEAFHGSWQAHQQTGTGADAAVLIGINPLVSMTGFPVGNPGKWLGESLDRGMKLVVIDPRQTDTAKRATLHIQPKPASDIPILAALIHVIIEEGLYDREFVAAEVDGFELLRATVAPFTPAVVAELAGVSADDLVRTARIYAGAKQAYVTAGTGANMAQYGTLVEYLILCMTSLCGRYSRANDIVANPGTLSPNAPFRAQARPPWPIRDVEKRLRVKGFTSTCAGFPLMAVPDEILMEGEGQIRAMISHGGNPAVAWPDQKKTVRALEDLDLLVQIDPFMSQTSKMADYVIAPRMSFETPSALWHLDQRATLVHLGLPQAYGNYTPAIVDPPAGSDVIADWEVYYGLAQRLGLQLQLKSINLQDISSQMGEGVSKDGVTLIDMKVKPTSDDLIEIMSKGSRVPLAEVKKRKAAALYPDPQVRVLAKEPGFAGRLQIGHPEMMAELSQRLNKPTSDPAAGFDFRLISRRMMHVHNSTYNVKAMKNRRDFNPLFTHPADLEQLGISDGETVRITSQHGEVTAVARADVSMRRGVVSITHNFGSAPGEEETIRSCGTSVQRLISVEVDYDPYTGMPKMSAIPVRIEPEQRRRALGEPNGAA